MDDKKHFPQVGIVTSVDNKAYRAKVYIPLLDEETDFIRISSLYVGMGWGLVSLPHIGQEVVVSFMNGDLNDGIIVGFNYSEESDSPPNSAELMLLHESGSLLRFCNNGNVELHAQGDLVLTGARILENC
ncbi:phage baseplate assembly protein V [uncultured Phascolarctobacterium sp.]|uniref:phage baseplate assembly protein V n=1 Tax=uncultured Phascolarctobacterium sp. TaxID=512296 RepID=UPI002617CEE4|nr:phage baseplate assembly protein V [uncultured Phascolarctobacterium sp.]